MNIYILIIQFHNRLSSDNIPDISPDFIIHKVKRAKIAESLIWSFVNCSRYQNLISKVPILVFHQFSKLFGYNQIDPSLKDYILWWSFLDSNFIPRWYPELAKQRKVRMQKNSMLLIANKLPRSYYTQSFYMWLIFAYKWYFIDVTTALVCQSVYRC